MRMRESRTSEVCNGDSQCKVIEVDPLRIVRREKLRETLKDSGNDWQVARRSGADPMH